MICKKNVIAIKIKRINNLNWRASTLLKGQRPLT